MSKFDASRGMIPSVHDPRPPEGSRLDRRTLNRTLLARQRLLERAETQPLAMVEHLVGMQAQVPRDPYVGLWSRLVAFDPDVLSTEIAERRAVRMTLMRTTLHLVTAGDAAALRAVLQPVVERAFGTSPFQRNLPDVDLDAVVAEGTRLVEERPRSTAELAALLGTRWPDRDAFSLAYAVRYLVPLVQVPPRGLWRRSGAPRVTTLRTWTAAAPVSADPAPARPPFADREAAVLRYLRAFGPATAADIRTWSGLTDVRATLDRLRPRLRAYRDDAGRALLDVSDGEFADAERPAPVRFLPEFDNVFLSHADRTRITGDGSWDWRYRNHGAFTFDGFLAGRWRLHPGREAYLLRVEPFIALAGSARDELEAEAGALISFLAPPGAEGSIRIEPFST